MNPNYGQQGGFRPPPMVNQQQQQQNCKINSKYPKI